MLEDSEVGKENSTNMELDLICPDEYRLEDCRIFWYRVLHNHQ